MILVALCGCGRLGFGTDNRDAWLDAGLDANPATITYVQRAEISTAARSVVAITEPFADLATLGDTIICSVDVRSPTASVIGVNDPGGNRYERTSSRFRETGALAEWTTETWAATVRDRGSAPLTVAATLDTPANDIVVSCHEYGGLASTSVVDVAQSMTFPGSGDFSLGPLQPTSANELLFVHWSSLSPPTLASEWTERSHLAGDRWVDKIVNSTSPLSAAATCLGDCTAVAVMLRGRP